MSVSRRPVHRRPAPARPPAAARGARRRPTQVVPLFVRDRAVDRRRLRRAQPAGVPRRLPARPRRRAARARRPAGRALGRRWSEQVCRVGRGGGARTRSIWPPASARYAPAARGAAARGRWRRRAAAARPRRGDHRRRRPGALAPARLGPLRRLHARTSGAGREQPLRDPLARAADRARSRTGSAPRRCPPAGACAGAARRGWPRAARRRAAGGSPPGCAAALGAYEDRPRRPGRRRHLPALARICTSARLSPVELRAPGAPGGRAGRRGLRTAAGLAGLPPPGAGRPARGGAPPTTAPGTTAGARSARPATTSRRGGRAAPATRWWTRRCGSCAHEGWMHNRARLLTASFLAKTLYVDWRVGARALPGPAGRRRRGQQPAQLAVGGGHRHRHPAQPGAQPASPRRSGSTPTGRTCGAGCRSWRTWTAPGGARAVEADRTGPRGARLPGPGRRRSPRDWPGSSGPGNALSAPHHCGAALSSRSRTRVTSRFAAAPGRWTRYAVLMGGSDGSWSRTRAPEASSPRHR